MNATYSQPSINLLQTQRLQSKSQQAERSLEMLKRGIWLYFFLLLFEGSLRKWLQPFMSGPLLIIRDPVALWLIIKALTSHKLRPNAYLIGMTIIGVLGIFTAVLLGHGNLTVALYGARILLLHFPLVFIIGRIFTPDDVIKMGRATLWITIPMTILVALQFFSPQSSWVNRGLGNDDAGSGFSGAMGFFRPSASFSFTNGTTLFYGFVACFVFYFWLNPNRINRLQLIAATMGLLIAVPLSISRGLFMQVGIAIAFTMVAVSLKPKYIWPMIIGSIGIVLTLAVLNETTYFQTAMAASTSRFETANQQTGGFKKGIVDRFFDGMANELSSSSEQQPFFGYGLGMGTNVGAQLLAGDRTVFLIAEGEWGRVIGELGPLMGVLVVLFRICLTLEMVVGSFKRLRVGNLLPWMLLSDGIIIVLQGGWAQPTALGFSTLTAGLLLASLRKEAKKTVRPHTIREYGSYQ